jgi:N-acetylmuramoyl-L-alanine amidase
VRPTAGPLAIVASLVLVLLLQAQGPAATPLTVVTREGRRPLPTATYNGQDLLAADDVASFFGLTLREDTVARGITLTARGRTIAASAESSTISVAGKLVSLPAPVVHAGKRWLVPFEFLPLAVGALADQRIQLRRAARLVLVGDVRVPRVVGRIESAGPPTRAALEITPPTAVVTTTEPTRITLRFDADALDVTPPPAAAGLLGAFRQSDHQTIVLALDAGAGSVRVTPQSDEPTGRVVIEVLPAATPTTTTTTAPAAPPEPPPAPPAGPPITVESLVASRAPLQTIVIDPGHGGDDVGARGAAGLEEKALTLDIARRLRALLEARIGARVILTRDGDTAVPPAARVAAANNNKGQLFLSLHANAAPTSAVEGAEVYYLALDREGEQARAAAARGAVTLPVVGGGTRPLELIPWELAQVRHLDASTRLADTIAEQLGARVPMGPSPVRRAPLRVLEGIDMPAALVEMAFLSSPAQETLAASEEFRTGVATALLDAIVRFRRQLEEARAR